MLYSGLEQSNVQKLSTAKALCIGLSLNASEQGLDAYYDLIQQITPYVEFTRPEPPPVYESVEDERSAWIEETKALAEEFEAMKSAMIPG